MKPKLTLIKTVTTEEKIAAIHKELDMKKARAKVRFELIKRLYGKR
jgi:predicted GIY-YIG superfamily endonuclease